MKRQEQNKENTQAVKPSIYVGFDLSKDDFAESWRPVGMGPVQLEDIRKMSIREFERTRAGVERWWELAASSLSPGQVAGVVMEVTSSFSLEVLAWLGLVCPEVAVSVIPGKRTSEWGASLGIQNKTDEIDARVLACYGAERQPPPTVAKDKGQDRVRWLLRARLGLVEQKTALIQQHEEAKREHLDAQVSKAIQQALGKVLRTIESEILKLEKQARKLIAQDAKMQADIDVLETIYGVGWYTAATVVAEFGDLSLFERREDVVAAAGLNPVIRTSGRSVEKRPHISKRGNVFVRRSLYLAAMASIRGDNMFSHMHACLVGRGKKKMVALVAVMRKLLTVMRAIVISGKAFDLHYESGQKAAVEKA